MADDPIRTALTDLAHLHADRWVALGHPRGYLAQVRQEQEQALRHIQTLQRKRGPRRSTLETVAKIRRWRSQAKPLKWDRIDLRLGYRPGGALQALRRARREGY